MANGVPLSPARGAEVRRPVEGPPRDALAAGSPGRHGRDRCREQPARGCPGTGSLRLAVAKPGSERREAPGSAVVGELHREVVVLRLHQLLHGLQVVALLRRDAQLVALDLGLDALGSLVADQLGDLLGVLRADALLQGDRDLADLTRLPRLARVEDLQRLVALDQLALEDVEYGGRTVVGRRRDLDGVL